MKNRLSQVFLEQQTAPKIVESPRHDWVEFGEGEYKNQYPQLMIAGQEVVIEEDSDLTTNVELKQFFANINGKGGTVEELLKKTGRRTTKENCNAMGRVEEYYLSNDWTQTRKKQYAPHRIPAFDTNDRTSPNAIYYNGLYSAGMDIYHTPDYVASTNWILTDKKVYRCRKCR